MAEEKQEAAEEQQQKPKKAVNKKLFIIIGVALIVLIAGGVLGYMMLKGKGKDGDKETKEGKNAGKNVLVALEPFVVNLSEQGRYLKVTMHLELADETQQQIITQKIPNLRDAVITLLSSKSAESVSSPDGKFQLKDEILLRVNQTMGKDIFKNLYFTEFVMQ